MQSVFSPASSWPGEGAGEREGADGKPGAPRDMSRLAVAGAQPLDTIVKMPVIHQGQTEDASAERLNAEE